MHRNRAELGYCDVVAKVKKTSNEQPPAPGDDSSKSIAKAFSDIELLAAADVIRSAISSGRKHVDVEALRRVLSKLTAAYESKSKAR